MYVIFTVTCPPLVLPNGMVNCSLGDDEVPSYEDTCSFTCNTGYELTGGGTRTCQSDGSWSNTEVICQEGMNTCLAFTTNRYTVCLIHRCK